MRPVTGGRGNRFRAPADAAALHFLDPRVLGRPRVVDELPRRKGVQRLPAVLTPAEIEGLLGALPPLHRAVLMVA